MDNNIQRNKNRYINCDAFITIFVSVTLTCIIAIILVLTEGARMRACKLYYRIANNCAVDSMFSLYHLPLWEYYHLLGIEFKEMVGVIRTELLRSILYDSMFLLRRRLQRLRELLILHVIQVLTMLTELVKEYLKLTQCRRSIWLF